MQAFRDISCCFLSGALAVIAPGAGAAPPASPPPTKVGFASLHGPVGFSSGHLDAEKGFDSESVRAVLDEALKLHCKALVLDIESPGGIVPEGEQIAEAVVAAQRKGLKVIAWYGQAASAASWIPFACKSVVSKSTGTCGASVIWSVGRDGKPSAVDAKFASATIGKIKNGATFAGHSPVLVDAIFNQSAEVWRAPDGSVAATKRSDADTLLDSSTTVLNMHSDLAIELGFAQGAADDRGTAAKVAGEPAVTWVGLDAPLAARRRAIATNERAWIENFGSWQRALPELFRLVAKAIKDSRTTTEFYEGDQIDTSGKIKNLGKDARDELKKYVRETLAKTIVPSAVDAHLYLSSDASLRARIVEAQKRVNDDVAAVVKLLEKHKSGEIDKAELRASTLADYLSVVFRPTP